MKNLPFKSLQPTVYKSLGMRPVKKLTALSNPCHDEQGRFCSGSGQSIISFLDRETARRYLDENGGGFYHWANKWLSGSDGEAKEVAYDMAMNNTFLRSALQVEHFGRKLPEEVNLYRVGPAQSTAGSVISFWPTRKMAESYQKIEGVGRVFKYKAPLEVVIPTGSGAGELWAHMDQVINVNIATHTLTTHGQKKPKPKPGAKPRLVKINGLLAHQTSSRVDPTRTTGLRNRWAAEMGRRFTALRRLVWKAIVDDDCFGLGPAYKMYRPTTHSNPCHDEQGRFCSTGGGGGSFSDIKGVNISEFDSWPSGDRKNYARDAVVLY
jgi:hypothetical protein